MNHNIIVINILDDSPLDNSYFISLAYKFNREIQISQSFLNYRANLLPVALSTSINGRNRHDKSTFLCGTIAYILFCSSGCFVVAYIY